MPDAGALEKYYETLTDAQLLNLSSEGGLTEQAEQVLADELKRRNLRASDVKRYAVPERIKLREEAQKGDLQAEGQPSDSLAAATSMEPTRRPTSSFEPSGSLSVGFR